MTGVVIRVTEFSSRVELFSLFCFSSLLSTDCSSNSLSRPEFDPNSGVAGINTVPQYSLLAFQVGRNHPSPPSRNQSGQVACFGQ